MRFEYIFRDQAESFQFYRFPKILFTEKIFKDLSVAAKVLYGLLLDRTDLSRENGWVDEEKRVYVYYSIRNVKKSLQCANSKACGLLKELDEFGLIERRKTGQGKPTIIYVKNFTRFRKSESKCSEKQNSCVPESGIPEFRKPESNNTEKNNTEMSETDPILILSVQDVDNSGDKTDKDEDKDERCAYRDYLYDQLSMRHLYENYPYDRETLDAILDLMLDTICSKRKLIRIAGDDKPVNVVKSQFMKLNSMHIEYVLGCMKKNGSKVRNMKQYLLAALYNAPLTMQSYYQAQVNNDVMNGKI